MELIFEILFELIFEGTIEASKNKKIPKLIRYPLIALIILFFLAVIELLLIAGIVYVRKSLILGLFLIIVGLYLAIMSIIKFKEVYLHKRKNVEHE